MSQLHGLIKHQGWNVQKSSLHSLITVKVLQRAGGGESLTCFVFYFSNTVCLIKSAAAASTAFILFVMHVKMVLGYSSSVLTPQR